MQDDERQAEWLARVAEHKALARLLRAGRLAGDDRARFDALTRLLLDAMLAPKSAQTPPFVDARPRRALAL